MKSVVLKKTITVCSMLTCSLLSVFFIRNSIADTTKLNTTPLTVTEKLTKIGSIPGDVIFYSQTLVTDSKADSIAFTVKFQDKDPGTCVILNNEKGEYYDTISSMGPIFSPCGKRLAFIARRQGSSYAVIDGVQNGPFESIANIAFNSDGSSIAFLARNKITDYFIVLNGVQGKTYQGIPGSGYPVFSPDGKITVYPAFQNSKWFMVINGEELERFDEVKLPCFSPDSKEFSYAAKQQGSWFIVRNKKKSGSYHDIIYLNYSPDSKHLAALTKKNEAHAVNLDGKEQESWEAVGRPVFSPDSQKIMYAVKSKNRGSVVVNNKKGPWFRKIGHYLFSEDSKHFSYMAATDKESFVVKDHIKGKNYDSVTMPVFSPDSLKHAYIARQKDKQLVVVNDDEQSTYDAVYTLMFSPDSKHIVSVVEKDKKMFILKDKRTYPECDGIGAVIISPDSNHICYQANLNGMWSLFIDEIKCKETFKGFVKNTPLIFINDNSFQTIAIRTEDYRPVFFKVEVTIN